MAVSFALNAMQLDFTDIFPNALNIIFIPEYFSSNPQFVLD